MEVRATCRWVSEQASGVSINSKCIDKVAAELNGKLPEVKWDFEGIHFFDNGPLTAQYLLVLDALNFCFWPGGVIMLGWALGGIGAAPQSRLSGDVYLLKRVSALALENVVGREDFTARVEECLFMGLCERCNCVPISLPANEELHYEHLARGLKRALDIDNKAFDAGRLQTFTGPMLRLLLQWPRKLPLEDERARLIREVGLVLEKNFGGLASNLITASKGSAVALVELVASHFPGFRDHSIYKSHQVFMYKRAQIFVADLWGAFQGQGLGKFGDINQITMFADYVVPAVLRNWGILEYSSALAATVDGQKELAPGSEEEVEIRACTITAVELLRENLSRRLGKEVTSVEVDWWLWSSGIESMEASSFHHTLTVYY